MVFWKGPSINWIRLSPPNTGFNNGQNSTCGDRNITNNEATYSPNGTDTTTEASGISYSTRSLANYDLGLTVNNRFLLADIVIGNQGPPITQFYSKNDGDWTNPNTWVTGSYSSTINANGSFPKERLHIANIGEGKKVKLDANIGNSYPDTGIEFHEQRLGAVVVEQTANDKVISI